MLLLPESVLLEFLVKCQLVGRQRILVLTRLKDTVFAVCGVDVSTGYHFGSHGGTSDVSSKEHVGILGVVPIYRAVMLFYFQRGFWVTAPNVRLI